MYAEHVAVPEALDVLSTTRMLWHACIPVLPRLVTDCESAADLEWLLGAPMVVVEALMAAHVPLWRSLHHACAQLPCIHVRFGGGEQEGGGIRGKRFACWCQVFIGS